MRLGGLDLNLVVALEAILRLRSVSAAARETHLTQPALSRALARLRDHFGDPIVVQVGRRFVPTAFGETLYLKVQGLIQEARSFSQMRADFDPSREVREFSILCSDYVTVVFLTRLIQRLCLLAPGITIRSISIDNHSEELFLKGDVDFRILPDDFIDPTFPDSPLFEDHFVSIAWNANPDIGETLDEKTFLTSRHVATAFGSHRFDSHLERYLKVAGIDLKVAMFVPSFVLLPSCVIGTPLLATIHARLAAQLPTNLPLRRMKPPIDIPPIQQTLQWHPKRADDLAFRWVRTVMKDVLQEMQGEPAPIA